MAKLGKKTVSVDKIIVDMTLNVRLPNNYDIDSLAEQIIEVGRITTPPLCKEAKDGTLTVLQGNRRVKAGQKLFSDPTTPQGVKLGLEKLEVLTVKAEELSPEEEMRLICDHGSQKPISKSETVLAVWRLAKSLFSEKQIITLMFYQLARYTGNEKKLAEVPSEPKAREVFLSKWLHGTVGNFMLTVQRMPEYVREQFLLTHKAQDGLLVNGEKVIVKISRERVTALSAAKSADEKKGEWDGQLGGPEFKALWEKFIKEDAGEPVDNGPKRLGARELQGMKDVMESELSRKLIDAVLGTPCRELNEMDVAAARAVSINRLIAENIDGIKNPEIKAVVSSLWRDSVKKVEETLKALAN